MAVPIQPLSDYVVAEAEQASNKTASGLYIPEKAAEKPKIATVVAVGPGKVGDDNERIKMTLKVGDKIIYKADYSTHPIPTSVTKYEYFLIREEDVLATVGDSSIQKEVARKEFKKREVKRTNLHV